MIGKNDLSIPPGSVASSYALGLTPAVVLSGLWAQIALSPPIWPALGLGWAIAAVGGIIGLGIKHMALGGDPTRFLFYGLVVNAARAGILLLIIIAVRQAGMSAFRPFLLAVLAGYFGCMVSEIRILHRMTVRRNGEQ